jgi:hypothetical protein
MAWDAARDEMLLVTSTGTLNDAETWTWDASQWVRQPDGNIAASVFGAFMEDDPVSRTVLLVSPVVSNQAQSVTFGWNGTTWHVLATKGPHINGIAVDPRAHGLVACGSMSYSPAFAVQARCWEWTGTSWLPMRASVPPTASRPVTIEDEVDDVDRAQILMMGWLASPLPGEPLPLRVWAWDGAAWKLLA